MRMAPHRAIRVHVTDHSRCRRVWQLPQGAGVATATYDAETDVLVVRKPGLPAGEDWTVTFMM